MQTQIDEILAFVSNEMREGRSLSEVLKTMGVNRSSYYRWIKRKEINEKSEPRITIKSITDDERKKIDEMKDLHPEMRHRQIQGMLQQNGIYISASEVYQYLKSQGKVEYYERRAAPWDEPLYEPLHANTMWGADWTKLRIGGTRWYLLTLIDFFSRMLIHHEVVPTVNSGHIKNLYEMGLANFNIPIDWHLKPELRLDQGSPNTSKITRAFFKDIGADLSFARVHRPTDNARTERFYRTIKQEEIYIVGDYQDEKTAKEVLGEYIEWYNEKRPHQALWNFTPRQIHETNNKTENLKMLRLLKTKSWMERKEYWIEKNKKRT